jgi:hypothetical protein
MITEKIGTLDVTLYNGIDELPAERYHKFNLYCLMASGIGNDVQSVQTHITLLYQALNRKDIERLKVLLENYHHSLHFIIEQMDTQSIAFACLVHSINGKEVSDISDESLKRISKQITKSVRRSEVLNILSTIKKKLKAKSKFTSPLELAMREQERIIDSLKDIQT